MLGSASKYKFGPPLDKPVCVVGRSASLVVVEENKHEDRITKIKENYKNQYEHQTSRDATTHSNRRRVSSVVEHSYRGHGL